MLPRFPVLALPTLVRPAHPLWQASSSAQMWPSQVLILNRRGLSAVLQGDGHILTFWLSPVLPALPPASATHPLTGRAALAERATECPLLPHFCAHTTPALELIPNAIATRIPPSPPPSRMKCPLFHFPILPCAWLQNRVMVTLHVPDLAFRIQCLQPD